MRIIIMSCVILALLPLAVLGHDLYLAYQTAAQENLPFGEKPVYFSDLGWLWVQYSPDTYDWLRRSVDLPTWRNIIDPVLQKPAILVLTIPAAVLALLTLVTRMIGHLPAVAQARALRRNTKTTGGIAIKGLDDKAKKRLKYKRK